MFSLIFLSLTRVSRARPGCFAFFAPKLFKRYERLLADYIAHPEYKDVKRPFANSVFPATTFNLGPKVETYMHYDYKNKTEGWISITALGRFDPKKGGHLILKELGLVIEFPPGSTILFPSAIIQHGNTPIQNGETRMSLTQFAAGGLFRYVDNGFRTEEYIKLHDPQGWREILRRRTSSWARAVQGYSNYLELSRDRHIAFYRENVD